MTTQEGSAEDKAAGAMGASRFSRSDLLALLVLLVVVWVVRGAWFGDPNADIDEQLYSLIGFEMTRGALPFVDLWDRKPIGLFALFAFAHAVGGPGPIAYQVLAALFTLAGAFMTYRLALTLVGRMPALASGVLYVFLMSIYGGYSANAEAFFVPMMLAMALLVRDPDHPDAIRNALLAMMIGGLALQVKYTVLPQCLFFGLWALWGQHSAGAGPARLVKLAAGFGVLGLLPTILVGLYYAAAGSWEEFLHANFLSFFDRLPASLGRLRSDAWLFLSPLIGLLIASAYAAWRLAQPSDRRSYSFICLWFLASLATVYLPATTYLYYFAALAGACALAALPLLDNRGPMRALPMVLVLSAFAYLLFLPSQYQTAATHKSQMDRLAAAITPRVDSRSCLFIFDGPTALYRMSGSCLPTRFIYPDHLNNAFEHEALGVSQVDEVARILAAKPPVIITADQPFTPQNEEAKALVMETVQRGYQPIASEKLHERTIRVWAIREEVAP